MGALGALRLEHGDRGRMGGLPQCFLSTPLDLNRRTSAASVLQQKARVLLLEGTRRSKDPKELAVAVLGLSFG